MNSPSDPIKVLYIAGDGRSGSTLLDLLLGQSQGYCSTGELSQIWQSAFQENYLCGCEIPLRTCEFWNSVVQEAFGDWSSIYANDILKRWWHVSQLRYAWAMTSAQLRERLGYAEQLGALSDKLVPLYRAIQTVSGAMVIIDSSKSPVGGFALSQVPGLAVSVVHLIRDSRAVAYSMLRRKVRPEVTCRVAYLGRYHPLKSALYWNSVHWVTPRLSHFTRYRLIKYEEFVDRPQQTLTEIGEWMGEAVDLSIFENPCTANISKQNHTVAGNPFRFNHGSIAIRLDNEWERRLSYRHRLLVTALTASLLKQYSYL